MTYSIVHTIVLLRTVYMPVRGSIEAISIIDDLYLTLSRGSADAWYATAQLACLQNTMAA